MSEIEGKKIKIAAFEGLSKVMKALSNPYRLEIVETLSQGELSVEGIVSRTGMTIANTSQHLQILKNGNLVRSRKEGHFVIYSLASDKFLSMYQHITKYAVSEITVLERMIERKRDELNTRDAVSLSDLEPMMASGNILLLDLRTSGEYGFGHIPGAISVPMEDLLSKLRTLANEQEIIAYCRGPFCLLADEAVKILRENGFHARRLSSGYPEWKLKQLN